MSWLDYLERININPPFDTAHQLGRGADGQVFSLPNQPDRVWKLSIVHEVSESLCQLELKKNIRNYEWIRDYEHPNITKVFDVQYIGSGTRETYYLNYFAAFYSVMERLVDLSNDDFKVISTLLQYEYTGPESLKKFPDVVWELNSFLNFDTDKVMEFHQFLTDCPIRHKDLGLSNVMKDTKGNFKLIDFDRIELLNK